MWVVPSGTMWQFWLPEKITENIVWNGVYRYEMLYFLGCSQEPTVNTAKTSILRVCDASPQTLLAASKYCQTRCFRCLTLKKNPKIATLHLKVPHTYIYGQGLAMDLHFGHFLSKTRGGIRVLGPSIFRQKFAFKVWDPQNWLFGVLATRKWIPQTN